MELVHEIVKEDVGKKFITKKCPCCGKQENIYITPFMGQILDIDIGKRIYKHISGNYCVESDEQRDKRFYPNYLRKIRTDI